MAIKANGALLEFNGYEFALVTDDDDSYVMEISDLDRLRAHKRAGQRIVFRAVYATPWTETTENDPR